MDFVPGKSYRQLKIGEEASFTKTITENGCEWHSSGRISMEHQLRKGRQW